MNFFHGFPFPKGKGFSHDSDYLSFFGARP